MIFPIVLARKNGGVFLQRPICARRQRVVVHSLAESSCRKLPFLGIDIKIKGTKLTTPNTQLSNLSKPLLHRAGNRIKKSHLENTCYSFTYLHGAFIDK